MKLLHIFFLIIFSFLSIACSKQVALKQSDKYSFYGDATTLGAENPLNNKEALLKLQQLDMNEEQPMRIKATVQEVCKKKGCWMVLQLDDANQIRVNFKDYGFFVPKDINEKTVIIDGIAKRKYITVERLQHLAEDAGKSKEDIELITEPEDSYTFVATSVLIEK